MSEPVPSFWLNTVLGITDIEASEILRAVRTMVDDDQVRCATVISVEGDKATVERVGYKFIRLPDVIVTKVNGAWTHATFKKPTISLKGHKEAIFLLVIFVVALASFSYLAYSVGVISTCGDVVDLLGKARQIDGGYVVTTFPPCGAP